MTPSLFYPRALALGAVLFAAGAAVWTAGAWLGVASWWYPALLWALAAFCGLVCFGAMRVYREVQHAARSRQRGAQRLMGGLRGTSVVRVYDPPSVEALTTGYLTASFADVVESFETGQPYPVFRVVDGFYGGLRDRPVPAGPPPERAS